MLATYGGMIDVRTEPECQRARITISVAGETGPAVDAVRSAELRSIGDGALRLCISDPSVPIPAGTERGPWSGDGIGPSGHAVVVGVVVPEGSRVTAETQFASITAVGLESVSAIAGGDGSVSVGQVGEARIVTRHGAAQVQQAELVQVESAAGKVIVHEAGSVRASSGTGSIWVGSGHDVDLRSESGKIELGRAEGKTSARTAGDVTVRDFAGGTARLLSTGTGNITVHATGGGDIRASTMSGSIAITAAADAAGRPRTNRQPDRPNCCSRRR
ncbi:hypothetical protein EV650_3045 [Kribbella kalugense]|uniref:Adhesin n=2 Tax=Kribbella kalugense TaxID=2512221 RepID=A0A4R8A3Z6_9ACTN|nr:hypothetical protein EV650_3045 [Kribbella kalugense]